MRNCLILGSGRSGTSLTAGIMLQAGYYMGDDLYPPDAGNPKGYFENYFINKINEDLLAQVVPSFSIQRIISVNKRIPKMQNWLLSLPRHIIVPRSPIIEERIKSLTVRQPFCFKDPRLSYTLNVWRETIGNVVFICVFREPSETALSIVKECQREPVLQSLKMDYERALNIWKSIYSYILSNHFSAGDTWLFLHINQFADGIAQDKIMKITHSKIDADFYDRNLRRSTNKEPYGKDCKELYDRLCQLAEYNN